MLLLGDANRSCGSARSETLGGLLWGQSHRVAQLLKPTDMVPLNACRVELVKVISPQIARGLLVTQDMVENDEHFMGEGHDGFLLAPSSRNAMIEGGEVVVLGMSDGPGDLSQDGPQVGVAFGGFATEPFAPTLLIARTDSRPGGQMLVGGKARHIGPDFGYNGCRSRLLDPDQTLRQGDGFLQRGQPLLNLLLHLL